MAESALDVFMTAENALRGGKFAEALSGYLRVVRGVPQFWRARFRIADTLLNFKKRDEALEIYKALAWQAIKGGQPLSGMVALRMASALDPNQRDAVEIVAQLYCAESDRVDRGMEPLPRRLLKKEDKAGDLQGLAGEALIASAAQEAADTSNMGEEPKRLPPIPLFSFLSEDAFVAVLGQLQLKRFVKDNKIITEGTPGDAFYVLAEGHVDVTRQQNNKTQMLAKLPANSVFGEMALVSKAPRAATVTATEDCDLLELKRSALEEQGHKLASITDALHNFTRDRFLTNHTATSPVFKAFPRSIRMEIVRKFKDFPTAAGDELITEGEAGEGLYLVMKGEVEVTKKDGSGEKVLLAKLKEGDVFGEISLLQDAPTTATVRALSAGELLVLPKREFKSTMARHPELKDELSKITAERVQKTREKLNTEVFSVVEEDDLIML